MRDLFKKDITIKIGAVLIAILFWLYVYNTADNPYKSRTFTNVPLKIENEASLADKGLVIKNKYRTGIDITIRGRQDSLDKVRDSDFEGVLDMAQIKSVNDTALDVIGLTCNQKDVSIESYSPQAIEVVVAKIKDGTFPVDIIPNVTLKPGYKILKITPNLETIRIEAEEAMIDSIDSIKATLDIKDIDRDITKKVDCKVYNKDGKEITSLSRNLNVDVKVEVAKEVPITLVVKGKPASDYIEALRTISPDRALITGPPEVLAKISELKTEAVDIENIKQNLNITSLIKLPDGVKLAEAPKEVAVNITIEQLALKDMIISKNDMGFININDDGSKYFEIKSESVTLKLKGKLSDINGLRLETMKPSVNVSGLDEGTHRLPLNIVLPLQVKLMEDVFVEVKVTNAAAVN